MDMELNRELFKAIRSKSHIRVKLYLDQGANQNAISEESREAGWSAVMLASFQGSYRCVEELIKSGADVNAASELGETALSLCLMGAGSKDAVITVSKLIDAGVDINKFIHDSDGMQISPLLRVAYTLQLMDVDQECRNGLLRKMIEHGADANCVNETGESLFEFCERYEREFSWHPNFPLKINFMKASVHFVKAYVEQKSLEKDICGDENEYSFQF